MNKYIFIFIICIFFINSCDNKEISSSNNINSLKFKQILFANGKDVKEDELFYAIFSITKNKNNYKVIDTKGSAIGINAPNWFEYIDNHNVLKKLYEDYLIFIYQDNGKNLDLISKQIDTIKINNLFNQYIYSNLHNIKNDKLLFKGLKKEGDWWVLFEINGERIYQYTVMYLMKKDIFNNQLDKIINNIN